jgi:hypothetical protein
MPFKVIQSIALPIAIDRVFRMVGNVIESMTDYQK